MTSPFDPQNAKLNETWAEMWARNIPRAEILSLSPRNVKKELVPHFLQFTRLSVFSLLCDTQLKRKQKEGISISIPMSNGTKRNISECHNQPFNPFSFQFWLVNSSGNDNQRANLHPSELGNYVNVENLIFMRFKFQFFHSCFCFGVFFLCADNNEIPSASQINFHLDWNSWKIKDISPPGVSITSQVCFPFWFTKATEFFSLRYQKKKNHKTAFGPNFNSRPEPAQSKVEFLSFTSKSDVRQLHNLSLLIINPCAMDPPVTCNPKIYVHMLLLLFLMSTSSHRHSRPFPSASLCDKNVHVNTVRVKMNRELFNQHSSCS